MSAEVEATDELSPVPWPCPTVLALGSASSPVEGDLAVSESQGSST